MVLLRERRVDVRRVLAQRDELGIGRDADDGGEPLRRRESRIDRDLTADRIPIAPELSAERRVYDDHGLRAGRVAIREVSAARQSDAKRREEPRRHHIPVDRRDIARGVG